MAIEIQVDIKGPLFDGRAEAAIFAYCRHVENKLGHTGQSMIRAYLPTQYKYLGHNGGSPAFNPIPPNAGNLVANIETHRELTDLVLITDGNVFYGPWIEGVDAANWIVWPHRRNPPPRRFPGYFAFRKITTVLNLSAESIAIEDLPPFLRIMND